MHKGKVLALDYGKKRIGVASGDFELKIAFPREIIENRGMNYVISKLSVLCEELEVGMVIVGLPLNMEDGQKENAIMGDVKIFVDTFRKVVGDKIEVLLFDERLSSFEAKALAELAVKPVKGQKVLVDAYAAQIILQRFFDKL